MSKLVIWNDTKYVSTLAKFFGEENIIFNNEQLETVLKNWNKSNFLIVLCELDWSINSQPEDLCGIELVKELRNIHNVTLPVLFVSFYSLSEIFNTKREILTAVGHDFYRLPSAPEALITFIEQEFSTNLEIRKLSVMELNDIKSFYCSPEGILTHELHYLNHYLNYNVTSNNHSNTYADLQNSISKIHELFSVDPIPALLSFQTIFPILTKENISEAVKYIVNIGDKLLKKNDEKENGDFIKETSTEPARWKVLFLDDQINEQHQLVRLMKANNINVICADNASDATEILKRDWKIQNSIMVVIADYRLYKKESEVKKHQKKQGYQFLKEIASTEHLVQLVAFSGLQRKFLLSSFKHYNIKTEVKSKTDYLSSEQAMQSFCDEIIELAQENLETIEAMPSNCEGFKSTLQQGYLLFRSSPAYAKMESNICYESTELVNTLIEENFKNPMNIEFISSTFESNKKPDRVKNESEKSKFPEKFLKNPDAYFRRLQSYLIARRVALWLYAAGKKGFIMQIETRMIAELLTGNGYATQKEKYSEGAYRQIISTNLGIKFEDFPANITIEERRWLQYDMGLSVFRDIEKIKFSFQKIQKYFSDFIKTDKSLCDLISKNNFVLSHKYKNSDYEISFDSNFMPILKSPTDIRVLYLIIEKQR